MGDESVRARREVLIGSMGKTSVVKKELERRLLPKAKAKAAATAPAAKKRGVHGKERKATKSRLATLQIYYTYYA